MFIKIDRCVITCLTWWRGRDLLVGVNRKFRGQSFKLVLADHVELFEVLHILKTWNIFIHYRENKQRAKSIKTTSRASNSSSKNKEEKRKTKCPDGLPVSACMNNEVISALYLTAGSALDQVYQRLLLTALQKLHLYSLS